MRPQLFFPVCLAVFLGGCVTGDSYPRQQARAYCNSLFACVDEDEIDFLTSYDDVDECIDEEADLYEDTTGYQSFRDGNCNFNSDKAEGCLNEISEVRDDPDCNGSMSILVFSLDVIDDDCSEIYCN